MFTGAAIGIDADNGGAIGLIATGCGAGPDLLRIRLISSGTGVGGADPDVFESSVN